MLKKILFNTFILLGLSACGGSSGGTNNHILPTPSVSPKPDTPQILTIQHLPIGINHQDDSIDIPLNQNTLITKKINNNATLQGYSQAYSFFGILKDNNANIQNIPITDGNHPAPTNNRSLGTITYIGKAIMQDQTQLQVKLIAHFGDSSPYVIGSLSPDKMAQNTNKHYYITLTRGQITDNTFKGKATNIPKESGDYSGTFWGDNASEMTGKINFNNKIIGAFGGQKQ